MGLSRRSLLVAGGAATAAVVGAGALVENDVLPGRSTAHELLGLNGPNGTIPDVAPGRIVRGTLPSDHLENPAPWAVLYPPGAPPDAALPAVVVLHYAGSSVDGILRSLGLAQFLAASRAPVALAVVDGADRSYWQAHASRDAGAMVLDDFLPMLADRGLEVSAPAWLGWSMGGYGVLRLAAVRRAQGLPNGPVLAVSPAIWSAHADAAPWAFDTVRQFDTAMALLAAGPRPDTRIDCGTGDPFYRSVRGFTDGTDIETHFEPGGHTAGYWRRELPAQLAWLSERIEQTRAAGEA